jgi:hypothetical protein
LLTDVKTEAMMRQTRGYEERKGLEELIPLIVGTDEHASTRLIIHVDEHLLLELGIVERIFLNSFLQEVLFDYCYLYGLCRQTTR